MRTANPSVSARPVRASTNPFQFTGREQDVPGIYYYRDHYYAPAILIFHSGLRLIARPLCVPESCGFAFSLANPSAICKEMGPNSLWTRSVERFVISRSGVSIPIADSI